MNKEEIIGVYSAMYLEKLTIMNVKGWVCDIYLTASRMVVIEKPGIRGRLEANKFHPVYIQSVASARERLKMNETPLDDLYKSGQRNLIIQYDDITVIDFEYYTAKLVLKIYFSNNIDKPKHKFMFYFLTKYHQDFHDLLSTLIPGKV
jgi:hypothetical protein